jgi:UDP-N-acetylglucosamine 2-epimerase (non-hydrolysing)
VGSLNALTVFLGTKAQYIKTAPVLRVLDRRGIPYRLIDSGQHAALLTQLRVELGVREPDVRFGGEVDVDSIPEALAWAARIAGRAARPRILRDEVFGPDARLCVVHGDTPSTVLSTLLARRAGLDVVHLEAGLRSHALLHPFPEELIRLAVMRVSTILFAPDAEAVENLRAMKVRGEVVAVGGNTSIDALRCSVRELPEPGSGPAVVTMHRVENLHRRHEVNGFVSLVLRIAADHDVRFVVHGPTAAVIERSGHLPALEAAGVDVVSLLPHREFTRQLAAAPVVVTDGGSVQEECALLGVPTLLWRHRTERSDGLGDNVVLLAGDPSAAEAVLRDLEAYRRPPKWEEGPSPAEVIVDHLAGVL